MSLDKSKRKTLKILSGIVITSLIPQITQLGPKKAHAQMDCTCYCNCYCNCYFNCYGDCYGDRGRR